MYVCMCVCVAYWFSIIMHYFSVFRPASEDYNVPIFLDNESAVRIAKSSEILSAKSKHIKLRYTKVSDVSDTISFAPTDRQLADALTKSNGMKIFGVFLARIPDDEFHQNEVFEFDGWPKVYRV